MNALPDPGPSPVAPAADPSRPMLIEAAGILDAAGVAIAPGALLLEPEARGGGILAAGAPSQVRQLPAAAQAVRLSLPAETLIPGLANAHVHLDLTHVGPVAFDPTRSFADWAGIVIRGRATDENGIRESVRDGVARSLRGGVVAVGDIAGAASRIPLEETRTGRMAGVSYAEFFGFGQRAEHSAAEAARLLKRARASSPAPTARLGVSPHAPYSAGVSLYESLAGLVAQHGPPLCTHLAESPEERAFIADAGGPLRALSERLGAWSDAASRDVGHGRRPIAHLAPILERFPMLLAHVNDCPDEDLETIAKSGSTVVWCPRGHAYFGRPAQFGPHRWKAMIAAGIPVCLGTDSIINLPPSESDRLSTLDEARFLWRGGERDAGLLMSLITTAGGAALALTPGLFTFAPGPILGVVAVRTGPIRAGVEDTVGEAVFGSAGEVRLIVHHGRWVGGA